MISTVSNSFTSENHAIMLWQPESCFSLRLYSFTLYNIFCTFSVQQKETQGFTPQKEGHLCITTNQYKKKKKKISSCNK